MDETEACIAQNIIALRFKKGYDSRFYYYYFRQKQMYEFFQSLDISSVQPSIKVPHLLETKVPILDLAEQQAIAEVLSSLDDKIDLLHRQNKTLEALAETLFRQWFVEEAEESWETTLLSKHTEVFRGLSYKGSGLADEQTGLPMHNLNSIYEGGNYKYEGIKFYKGEYKERHIVKASDIIVANTEQGHEFRLIGFPAVVPSYFGDTGLFSQHLYKITILKESYLTNQFLFYLIMTPKVREQIRGATNGSTVNMLAVDGLQITEFQLPPEERVLQFSDMVVDYWKKRDENQNQIRTLTRLRDALLPKLMSGEMRVELTKTESATANQ
jgi:type I restriction enzyme S subunit